MKRILILFVMMGIAGLGGCQNTSDNSPRGKTGSDPKVKMAESFVHPVKNDIKIDERLLSQHEFEVLWTLPIRGDEIEKVYLLGDSIYAFAPREKFLYRIDRRNGVIKWSFRLKEGLSFKPALWEYSKEEQKLTGIQQSDELVVIAKNYVYIIDKEFGVELASIKLEGVAPAAPPGILRHNIFICGWDNRVYSFSKKDQIEVWRYLTGGDIQVAPLGAPGFTKMDLVYVASTDGFVYGLNGTNGSVKAWNHPLRTYGRILAPPIYHKQRIYVASTDSNLYCVNAATGTKIWSYICEAPLMTAPVAITTTVYALTKERFLYALNYSSGKLLWRFPSTKDTVALTNNKVLTGEILSESETTDSLDIRVDGKTLTLDRASIEKVIWGAHKTSKDEAPVKILARGREHLFILNKKSEIVSMDDKTGILEWKIKAENVDFFLTNPSPYNREGTVEDRMDAGVIYMGFKSGWLVAIREKDKL